MGSRGRLYGKILPLTLLAGLAFLQNGGRSIIHYKYPAEALQQGGLAEKDIDCGTLYCPRSMPDRFLITCAFATQADPNSQKNICTSTNPENMPPDEKGQIAQTNVATAETYDHFALVHYTCRYAAASLDYKLRVAKGTPSEQAMREVSQKYNRPNMPDWQTQKNSRCALSEAWGRCAEIRKQTASLSPQLPFKKQKMLEAAIR